MKKTRFSEDGMDASRIIRTVVSLPIREAFVMQKVIGLDIAKRVFQLHSVDPQTGEIERRKLSRGELLEHFARLSPATIAMEACSSSQHWARRFSAMGHEVRLIATKFVRPFVKTNKTDAADAAAIWESAQRPGMRFVPVKSEQQQGILALHNMRDLLVKSRTAQIHQIRAVFYEYGIDLPSGRHWGLKAMPTAFARAEGRIETVVLEALRSQLELIHDMSRRIERLEEQLGAYERSDDRCRRLWAIPGVGPLTATAVVAYERRSTSVEATSQPGCPGAGVVLSRGPRLLQLPPTGHVRTGRERGRGIV